MKAVILSYNHPDLTEKCVKSCLQFFSEQDVFLVHNGSLEINTHRLRQRFPSAQHLVLTKNRGYSGGANFGLQQAFQSTERVLFLTNDCVLTQFSATIFGRGFAAPLILVRQTDKVDSLGGYVLKSQGRLVHNKDRQFDLHKHDFYFPGTAFLIDKQSFEKIGPMDESLGTYWEDVDFSLRARKLAVTCTLVPEIVVRHGVGKTCHNSSYYTSYLYQRNRKIVMRRHANLGQRILFEINYSRSIFAMFVRKIKNKKTEDLRLLYRAIRD